MADSDDTRPSISERLAAWTTAVRFDELAPSTVDRVKQFLLDCLGIAIRGSTLDSARYSRSCCEPQGT